MNADRAQAQSSPQTGRFVADDAAHSFDAHQPVGAPAVFAGYVATHRSPFLSTLTPGRSQWRAAWAVVALSLLLFAATVPFAQVPLAQVPAFLPIYQTALIVVDLITMVLLLGQYAILRFRSLLVLACGYLFGALMAAAHALSFPGLFSADGLLGGGQSTAWLYFLWHAGFPLFVLGYTGLKGADAARPSDTRVRVDVLTGMALTVAAAMALAVLAQVLAPALPLMRGNADGQVKAAVAVATWLVGAAALVALWLRRPHSVIDLWLMVVLCVWAADTALAAVFNNARYDVGWYVGRLYGLVASSFVLAVLLLENSMLYARLVEANEAQRRRAAELHRLSTELEAANRDLDAFAGGLAHDLQQPITSIGAFAQVIQRQSGHLVAKSDASHLQYIINATQMAHRMIRSLLDFARLGERRIELKPVNLGRLVEDARGSLSADTTRVRWHLEPLPVVQGDASLLLLALINLLSNAAKYSAGQPAPEIRVECHGDPADGWRICVRDNGIGFEMKQASRLFRPFERLHSAAAFEGTGMGLANVRRIMVRHGGSVEAASAPGQGAAFTLVFPGAVTQAA